MYLVVSIHAIVIVTIFYKFLCVVLVYESGGYFVPVLSVSIDTPQILKTFTKLGVRRKEGSKAKA